MAVLRKSGNPAIFTIGHSNRPLLEFPDMLRARAIECVADARSFPRSRYNPQVDREAPARALSSEKIAFEHRPGRAVNSGTATALRDNLFDYAH